MKLKIILLTIPAITLLYVFVLRDRIDVSPGIGGGGYDLTRMYTSVAIGAYLLILNIVLLVLGGNRIFLLIGAALLIITIIIAAGIFR